MKKLLCMLLAMALSLSLLVFPAGAEDTDPLTRAENAAAAAQQAADAALTAANEADEVAAQAEAIEAKDKSAAQDARKAADEAMTAALAAQTSADTAADYRDRTKQMLDEGNTAAAEIWAGAAESSLTVAVSNQDIAQTKLATAKTYLEMQKTIAAAENAGSAAEAAALAEAKQKAGMELAALAEEEGHGAPYTDITSAAAAAIEAAETKEEVEKILQDAKDAIAARKVCPGAAFSDVDTSRYYHEAVDYMVSTGYMDGMGNGVFGVDGTLTRGQLVTILYRVAGSPDVSGLELPFEDVDPVRFYANPIRWAAAEGIVKGIDEKTYCPEDPINREQIVTILFRYAKAEETAITADSMTDFNTVSTYAKPAVAWAVENGIISGIQTPQGLQFQPKGDATRAQCATILARFLK